MASTVSTGDLSAAAASALESGAKDSSTVTSSRAVLKYLMPLGEVVSGFFEQLKSLSSGFASLDWEDAGWELSDAAKMTISVNGNAIGQSCGFRRRSE